MLAPASVLSANIKQLSPSAIQAIGVTNFVNVICDYMDTVQGGSNGTPGILTMNRPIMITMLEAQLPVPDSSWIAGFVAAWQQGVLLGTITPGTVTNPAWLGSGGLDVNTLPSPAATIITLTAAAAVLQSGLAAALPDSSAPLPFAEAINAATLAFTFLCIGLAVPPTFIPTPIPIGAE